jgi:hypothetical protein
MILQHLAVVPFLAGMVVAYLALKFYKPQKQVIVDYPKPGEESSKLYKDRNGTCYTYTSHEVDCDANESTLKDYPIQS